jgi:hypothetical protein
MGKVNSWKVQLSIVLAAILVAFAPIYHAVCVAVAATTSASSATTSMIMPDGTVMTHAGHVSDGTGTQAAPSLETNPALSFAASPEASNGVNIGSLGGTILLVAGIVVLTVFLVKLWAQAARRIALRDPPRPAGRRRFTAHGLAWHGPPPDLAVLCISRT